jgi:hypothetical protein
MKRAAIELATPAEIARVLRRPESLAHELASARARLGWVTRRLHEAERPAGALIEWRRLRDAGGDLLGDFSRRA